MKRKIWNLVVVIGLLVFACGLYFLVGDDLSESWAVMVTETDGGGTGTSSTQSVCGSYYSYPRRCSEGYESKMVAYGGRTCYTSCIKKTIPAGTSDFCAEGYAFASLSEATNYCNGTGYLKATQSGTTTSGKICAICFNKKETCQSQYGELDSYTAATAACGGSSYVVSKKRSLNGTTATCYACDTKKTTETVKCTPSSLESCTEQFACEMVGGKWVNSSQSCEKEYWYSDYASFCKAKGYYLTEQACPENYDSKQISSGGAYFSWTCYSGCTTSYEYLTNYECESYGLLGKQAACASGYSSTLVNGTNGTFPKHVAYSCYTPCLPNSDASDITVEVIESEYEALASVITVTGPKGYYAMFSPGTTEAKLPTEYDPNWVQIDKDNEAKFVLSSDSGYQYLYIKTLDGSIIFLSDTISVKIPANNDISIAGVGVGLEANGNEYYAQGLESALADIAGYVILGGNSLTYPANNKKIVMLDAVQDNKKLQMISSSTESKTLTVDATTGLLLYTLSESEKTALGITDEKVYVASAKEKTKVIRNSDGTFTKDASGSITAASTGEKGTIYKITPRNDIATMSENVFYAIVLDYTTNASYSDGNSWNDINLLSYNNMTTIDTDFTFKVARKGFDGKVTKLSSTSNDVKVMPLASSTDEDLGTFYIDFESGVTQYEFSVSSSEVTLNPVLVYTDSEYVEGFGPRTVSLDYGLNIEYIKVESAKGSIVTYTLLITRIDDRNSDNTLKSLTARNVKLTPTFNKYTNTYYGTVANSTNKVEIAAEKSDSDASFVSGYGSRTVDLKVGKNTILVKVVSETGAERVYKLIITREGTPEETTVDKTKSANNNLELLTISSGSLMFDSDVTNYNLYVSNSITSVLVTAVVEDEKATIVTTGGSDLQVGTNKVEIVVTAENGTTKTYTINVIRKEGGLTVSTDSTLSDLTIGGKNINFSPTNYLYSVTVFPGVEELSLSLTPSSVKAQIEVIGNQELSDYTTVKVKVIAEDGSYSIYDINVSVNNITKTEIAIFIGCCVLVVGLIVYGTISRNKKRKEQTI